MVMTPRPADLMGRVVTAGTPLVQLGAADSIEVRITLHGGGAASVSAGQRVSIISDIDAGHPRTLVLGSVSVVADSVRGRHGAVNARLRIAASTVWRPGTRGLARVTIGRTTVFGALVWAVRTRIRPGLLL